MAENANDKNIVVSSDLFKFLEKYNLKVYSLEENENLTDKTKEEVKKLINNGQIKYIFVRNDEEINSTIQSIIDETNVEVLYLHTLTNLKEEERKNNDDYISIMNDNLDLLKQEVYE